MKKRVISLVLALTLILTIIPATLAAPAVIAEPTASKVIVDGKEISFDAYNINEENYFKLRDVAYTLNGTRVQFDANLVDGAINLYKNTAYTPNGSEMQAGVIGSREASLNKMKIFVDGVEVELTAYLIGGNNYFKMRELMMTFDYHGALVDGVIVIDTNKPYVSAEPTHTPTPVYAGDMGKIGQFQTISADSYHTVSIKTDNSLWAWGRIMLSQFGDTSIEVSAYTPIKILDDVTAVSAGYSHTAVIKTDGSLWTWGENDLGQLGDGTNENKYIPIKIMDGVAAVSTGIWHTTAIKTDGSLWAWGANNLWQLGDGTYEHMINTPIKIMNDVAAVSAGSSCTAAIKTDGSLWTWGLNLFGQLGDGTDKSQNIPIKIMDGVAAVSVGNNHTAAIKTDGSLWAWGWNSWGELGDGTNESRYTPVKIMENVAAVSAGSSHTAAIKTDGSLWVWGSNWIGQIGDGTITTYDENNNIVADNDRKIPVKIMDGVAAVSVGNYHTVVTKTDGSLCAWGWNALGQLGDGTNEDKNTPVKIMDGVKLP